MLQGLAVPLVFVVEVGGVLKVDGGEGEDGEELRTVWLRVLVDSWPFLSDTSHE
jgi:hypothetical protein